MNLPYINILIPVHKGAEVLISWCKHLLPGTGNAIAGCAETFAHD